MFQFLAQAYHNFLVKRRMAEWKPLKTMPVELGNALVSQQVSLKEGANDVIVGDKLYRIRIGKPISFDSHSNYYSRHYRHDVILAFSSGIAALFAAASGFYRVVIRHEEDWLNIGYWIALTLTMALYTSYWIWQLRSKRSR